MNIPINLINMKFGKLIVLKRDDSLAKKSGRHVKWLCSCECGNIVSVYSSHLKTKTKSCGCLKESRTLPKGIAARNNILYTYKANAKRRNLSWNILDTQFYNLIESNCHYCGIPPANLKTNYSTDYLYNGIDRIDSNLGYEVSNLLPCCSICNRAKYTLSYEEYKTWLNRIKK